MALTRAQIDKAKPKVADYRLSDGAGLIMMVRSNGTKTWVFRFKRDGKDAVKTLGQYPQISPEEARAVAANLKSAKKSGIDPAVQVVVALPTSDATFKEIAERYIRRESSHWAKGHLQRFQNRMDKDVYRAIGAKPICDIKPRDVMIAVNGISQRGSQNTAVRVAGMIGQVCRYAVALDLRDDDPTIHMKSGLDRPPAAVHRPALTEPDDVAQLMADLHGWAGDTLAKPFLMLCAHTFQRPGEIAAMRWADIDLEARQWIFRVTKVKLDHIVPLTDQAVAILRQLEQLRGHDGDRVFRSGGKTGIITPQVGIKLLTKLGYHGRHCAHGFRATARTLIVERLRYSSELVERQLSHAAREALGRAYDRTAFIEDRAEMMQTYADYLDQLRMSSGPQTLLLTSKF